MTDNKRNVVVFDFDGTLTTRDTLLLFIRFCAGTRRFVCGMLLFLPLIVLMKLKLYDNSKCKERVFSWFFKGMSHADFTRYGQSFASQVRSVARTFTTEALARHRKEGDTLYIISASIEEWVAPYCRSLGADNILATQVEVDADGKLTGRFASPNCYGAEKVRRLLAVEPNRDCYHLTAYGDSDGDLEMFALADKAVRVRK